ncbi:MAG: hypothetical protein JXR68_03180 [Bacteroidales bacterium]|nr:hypothetical protein [Bacteroidales bacterium]
MIFKIILFLIALLIFFSILLVRNPKILSKVLMFMLSKNKNKQNNLFEKKQNNKDVVIEKKRANKEELSDFEVIEDKKANSKH